jgi:hypothetical protein
MGTRPAQGKQNKREGGQAWNIDSEAVALHGMGLQPKGSDDDADADEDEEEEEEDDD